MPDISVRKRNLSMRHPLHWFVVVVLPILEDLFERVFQPIPLRLNYRLISTICYLQRLFIHKKITPARLACLCFQFSSLSSCTIKDTGLCSKQLSSKWQEHKHDNFFGSKSFRFIRTNDVYFCRKLSSLGKQCMKIPCVPVLLEQCIGANCGAIVLCSLLCSLVIFRTTNYVTSCERWAFWLCTKWTHFRVRNPNFEAQKIQQESAFNRLKPFSCVH